MKQKIIKVGFCVAYDWELLRTSIPRVYDHADVICLSIDKSRRTWRGEPYEFDEKSFRDFISSIDKDGKIDLYEDNFSMPELTAMENDTRQRQLMANRMGKGGWHIQVDSDEYFIDFKRTVDHLKRLNPNPTGTEKPFNVCCFVIPLIKKTEQGYLIVDFKDQMPETMCFATTKPEYLRARNSGHFNKYIPVFVIHETWARPEEQLWKKINNWGHSSEELEYDKRRQSYYKLWKSVDEYNCQYIADFHPAIAKTWPAILFVKASTIKELLDSISIPSIPLRKLQWWMKNNRQAARIRWYSSKIWKRFLQ